jgi:DNA-directed RNA polymerase subunit RPC12/RpoP
MESSAYKFFRGVAKMHYSGSVQSETLSTATAFGLEKRHEVGRWPCPQARAVRCSHCDEERLFTLRAIAEDAELKCPGCGRNFRFADHEALISEVKNTLHVIDTAQSSPTFMGR